MTIRSDIIAILDGVLATGQRNYADNAPEGVTYPYTVLLDGIALNPDLRGDTTTLWWKYMGQVDVWERLDTEDEALYPLVVRALDGAKVASGMHLEVQSSLRVADPDFNLSHRAITVRTSQPG